MATVLPPDLSTTFVAALLVPLVLGFLVGMVVKTALKVGAAIALIVVILILVGAVTPSQVIQPIVSAVRGSGPEAVTQAKRIAGYLPYSSLTFVIGLAIGFFK